MKQRILSRVFTTAFKREAIKPVTEQDLTMTEASRKSEPEMKLLR